MKGEFMENQENNLNHNHNHHNPPNYNAHTHPHHPMFPNPKYPPPHLHFPPHSFPFTTKDSDFPPKDLDPSAAATTAVAAPSSPPSKKPKITSALTAASEDGGTIEVSRRPRGRPRGSKNKPKPPVVITRETEPAMSPYILELPGGCDIVDSLTSFTRRRGIGICVLTATGAVANVTLKQPSTAHAQTVTFHGRFDILSLSALCLVHTVPFGDSAFTISLAGPQGQIVGGMVVGPLISAGTVYIIATSFNSPSFHRLPLDDNDEDQAQNQGDHGQSSSFVSGDGSGGVTGGSSGGGGGGCGGVGQMGLYSCHMGSAVPDVMWAPAVRPSPPY